MNHKKKTDVNQSEIVKYLRAFGVWVEVVSGAGRLTDLIVYKSEPAFLEVKVEGSKAVYTKIQLQFIADCKPPVGIVKTKEDALAFASNPRGLGLSQKQKDGLTGLILRNAGKQRFTPKEVSEAIDGK